LRSFSHSLDITLALVLGVVGVASGVSGPVDPNPTAATRLFALGDSYTSGEGAKKYFDGTNLVRSNECRRAPTAYPRLVAERKKLGLTFVACSGATTEDVLNRGQEPNSPSGVFGAETQISALTGIRPSDIITIGIGGNDAGFGKVVQTCLRSNCGANQELWLEQMPAVEKSLVATYQRLREFGATVFALTYPNPLAERDCVLGFSESEWTYLRDQYLPALNNTVRAAAKRAGVNVIDVESAFVGYRVCETSFGSSALNVIAISRTGGTHQLSKYLHNSFHPNKRGHALLALAVQEAVTRTTGNPSPPAVGLVPPPLTLPAPSPDPPAPVPEPAGGGGGGPLPEGIAFPSESGCGGTFLSYVLEDTAGAAEYTISDALPDSQVCVRDKNTANGWTTSVADPSGTITLQIEKRHQVIALYQDNMGAWNQLTVLR
jgi:lysophospholipase L1-like esterase